MALLGYIVVAHAWTDYLGWCDGVPPYTMALVESGLDLLSMSDVQATPSIEVRGKLDSLVRLPLGRPEHAILTCAGPVECTYYHAIMQ